MARLRCLFSFYALVCIMFFLGLKLYSLFVFGIVHPTDMITAVDKNQDHEQQDILAYTNLIEKTDTV